MVEQKCTGCKKCTNSLGCPAISFENGRAKINQTLCTGCQLCSKVCPFNAISQIEK
ncbi:MAG: 4Fe-4S binding protein [Oscillospiraceae bacterium]